MDEVRVWEEGEEKTPYRFELVLRSVAVENSGLTVVDAAVDGVAEAGVDDLSSCLSSLVGLRSCTCVVGTPANSLKKFQKYLNLLKISDAP